MVGWWLLSLFQTQFSHLLMRLNLLSPLCWSREHGHELATYPLKERLVAPAVSSCRVGFRACPQPKTDCSGDGWKGAPILALCSVAQMGLAKAFSCLLNSSASPSAQSTSSLSLPQLVIPIKHPACQPYLSNCLPTLTAGIRRSLRKQATDAGLDLNHSPIETPSLMVGGAQTAPGTRGW